MSKLYTLPLILLIFWSNTAKSSCEEIIPHYKKVHPVESWDYDWTTAIFLYGALKYSEKYPDKGISAGDYQSALKALEDKIPEVTTPDLASMSLSALSGPPWKIHSDKILSATRIYFKTEPLNGIDTYDHVGKRHRFYWFLPATHHFMSSSLWADSMVMYVLNGYRMAKQRGDLTASDFFVRQIFLFDQYLKDSSTGLYKHAYFVDTKKTVPENFFWARGNMWVSMALIDMLEIMNKENPHRKSVVKIFKDHLDSVLKYAEPDQGLRTLLNDKTEASYFESSATALLGYVLTKGMRLGLLDKAYGTMRDKIKATALKFEDKGSISGISGPTTAFKYPWYYTRVVGQVKDESYGVGSYLLLCSEI